MADTTIYLAVGEEATRGTAETSTVGFIPMNDAKFPALAPEDKARGEFRGESTVLGDTAMIRMSEKWSWAINTNFFTEAGTTKGIIGTLLKHFFGYAVSAQNGATGQYYHMLYPVADPFATANLGTKALTFNYNIVENAVGGGTTKNHAFKGGRVKALTFDQVPSEQLKLTAELFGQTKNAAGTAIASPVYAAENLRCDYKDFSLYTGTISRTGSGPNFTAFTFGSATQFKPDKVTLKLENGMEDILRLGGVNYPDKTRMNGKFKASLEITIDLEAPGSGFDSWVELKTWLAGASTTNFCLVWDTGTQAGTGDNHMLVIDLPVMQRMGGDPDIGDKNPMITLKYEGLYDATTCKYIAGLFLKNTASAL